jgi:hypothetical protein
MSSLGIMPSKKASKNPGLCPIKGQESGLHSRTGTRGLFRSLSLSTTKTLPHCQMLVIHPAFYLSSTNIPKWETLASCRKLSRICALFKAYSGERAWKAIGDRIQRPHYLCRVHHKTGKLGVGGKTRTKGNIPS